MRNLSGQLAAAIAAIDAANAEDPNQLDGRPLAQLQGERASFWLDLLDPDPTDALALAARAHHLRRWQVPRADFADGRDGYLRWRRANKSHQAVQAGALLGEHGYAAEVRERSADLLRRRGLGTDRETQTLEDVACLVFLETQFEPMVARLDRDHVVRVVAKTLAKMSRQAIDLSTRIDLSSSAAAVVADACRPAAAGSARRI